jgi:hypothetical protein
MPKLPAITKNWVGEAIQNAITGASGTPTTEKARHEWDHPAGTEGPATTPHPVAEICS